VRAAVFVGVDAPMEVEDVTPVEPGPTDVVVRVDGSGVCHTDVAILHGDLPWPAPSILGHEATGVVVETGPAVTRVHVGDRVVGAGIPACGNCFFCIRDQAHLCEKTLHHVRRGPRPPCGRHDHERVRGARRLRGSDDG